MRAPLHGVTVADFSELLPGPFTTQALVELGAKVIKVERPPAGDPVRKSSPGLFGTVNRGKESVVLNLKTTSGREQALNLASSTDVVVEGYRPGVMARLGLDYKTVSARNPSVVYLSLTGYGQDSPLSDVPGHDLNYLAAAGVTSLCGEADGPPAHGIGLPIADLGGAMYALSAILAALFQREKTGKGQHLDVSMTDCAAHFLNVRKGVCHVSRLSAMVDQRRVALTRPAYGVFACRDGAITIAALEGHFWKALVTLLDLSEFAGEEHMGLSARLRDCAAINEVIARRMGEQNRDEAVASLLAADIPAAPVLAMTEAESSAHFVARGLAVETSVGKLTPFPVRLKGMVAGPMESSELNQGEVGLK